ncbi:MAG: Thiol-disulfide oxidoreductase ResA [Paracidovorax wautersii]|uniref:Thiol-disulfide oxidoreductase ResA n=1 Tax=Paracidovorax wautersii TaxID=1177982 RepID=A0A7V8FKZ8_9BURK|nr:MAG: Thiol-disulfide oxidoreductase ResA [Paracidovorax wautersii]
MPSLPRRKILQASAAVAATAAVGGLGAWATAPEAAPAHAFTLLEGGSLHTAELQGRVALVNFWATSCVTCVAEMPQFVRLFQTFQASGLRMLAVAMQYDRPDYVAEFVRTRQLPFQIALDTQGEGARLWGEVQATPTTFLLDRQSQIVQRIVGAPDFAELHTRIQRLLA